MHAVGEVHVQMAGWAKHHQVARRRTAERVACGVVRSVGLDLDQACGETRAVGKDSDEDPPQQVGRDLRRRPREERSRQSAAEPHRPFRRNVRNLASGHALITSSFVSHPRCAMATPYLMWSRWVVACESVSTANFTP